MSPAKTAQTCAHSVSNWTTNSGVQTCYVLFLIVSLRSVLSATWCTLLKDLNFQECSKGHAATRWGVLCILTSKGASFFHISTSKTASQRKGPVHFDFQTCFVTQSPLEKTPCFATLRPFPAPASSFVGLILWSSLYWLFFFSDSSHLFTFPSVHIVGSWKSSFDKLFFSCCRLGWMASGMATMHYIVRSSVKSAEISCDCSKRRNWKRLMKSMKNQQLSAWKPSNRCQLFKLHQGFNRNAKNITLHQGIGTSKSLWFRFPCSCYVQYVSQRQNTASTTVMRPTTLASFPFSHRTCATTSSTELGCKILLWMIWFDLLGLDLSFLK